MCEIVSRAHITCVSNSYAGTTVANRAHYFTCFGTGPAVKTLIRSNISNVEVSYLFISQFVPLQACWVKTRGWGHC